MDSCSEREECCWLPGFSCTCCLVNPLSLSLVCVLLELLDNCDEENEAEAVANVEEEEEQSASNFEDCDRFDDMPDISSLLYLKLLVIVAYKVVGGWLAHQQTGHKMETTQDRSFAKELAQAEAGATIELV